jgi:Ca-activated chloride channel family protein
MIERSAAAQCFAAGLAAALGSSPAQEPSAPLRFRTEVRTVLVPVSVKDASGRPVSGLAVSAFTILDQGEARPIVFFDERDEPLSTVLVLDVSSSMRGERLSEAKRAAKTFVERIARDVGCEVDERSTRSSPSRSTTESGSHCHGSLMLGESCATSMPSKPEEARRSTMPSRPLSTSSRARATGGRAIVVLSDGKDEDSSGSFTALRKRVEASGVSLFAVGFYTTEERRSFAPGRQYFKEPPFEENLNPAWVLAELTGATGGLALFPSNGQDLSTVFDSIAVELRHQYLLGFEPDSEVREDFGFRTIEILVSSPEHVGPLRVRGRQGYAPRASGV